MKPCAFTASRTPIRSRTGTLQGRSDSPTWKRGNTSRSTIATVRPPRDRKVAALGGRERVHLAVPSPESRWTEDPDHVERGRGGLTRPARHDAGGQEGPDR